MKKTYRFIDCTNQLVEAADAQENRWMFMINDTSNTAQQEWASTEPLPEIEVFPEPCPPDPDFEP